MRLESSSSTFRCRVGGRKEFAEFEPMHAGLLAFAPPHHAGMMCPRRRRGRRALPVLVTVLSERSPRSAENRRVRAWPPALDCLFGRHACMKRLIIDHHYSPRTGTRSIDRQSSRGRP
jgi:hypothetical protein